MDLKEKLTFSYDPEADVLYASVGSPRNGVSIEDEDGEGLVVRIDPETEEVIGITVIDFLRRMQNPGQSLTVEPHSKQSDQVA